MMSNSAPGTRRTNPPSENDQVLSPRDRLLVRVEELLAEQCLMPFPGQEDQDEGEPTELINVETVVEIAKLPPSVTRPPAVSPPDEPSAFKAPPEAAAPAPAAAVTVKPASVLAIILQSFILLFVIAWVFIFGILIGRGHLWESGLGHDLVVWLESQAGWSPRNGPAVVLKDSGAESARPEQVLDDHDPMLDDELIELAGPVTDPGPAGASPPPAVPVPPMTGPAADGPSEAGPAMTAAPPDPADSAARSSLARLVGNVVLDWSGRQWFEEEAARRRAEARASLGLEPEGDSGSEPGEVGEPAQVAAAPAAPAASAETGAAPPAAAVLPLGAEPPGAAPDSAAEEGRFAVQVILAHDENEAKRRVERLEQQGFIAYFYKNASGRLPVRVGHFPTRKAAEAARDRLKALGYTNPYISSLGN